MRAHRNEDSEAIYYATALSLDHPEPQCVLIKRNKVFMETGSWKRGLEDADQVHHFYLMQVNLVDVSSSGDHPRSIVAVGIQNEACSLTQNGRIRQCARGDAFEDGTVTRSGPSTWTVSVLHDSDDEFTLFYRVSTAASQPRHLCSVSRRPCAFHRQLRAATRRPSPPDCANHCYPGHKIIQPLQSTPRTVVFSRKTDEISVHRFQTRAIVGFSEQVGTGIRAQTAALMIVEIKSEDLSRYSPVYLIHPWIDFLLDWQSVGNTGGQQE